MHVKVVLVLTHVQRQVGMVWPPPKLLDVVETVETMQTPCVQGPSHHLDVMCVVHQRIENVPTHLAHQQAKKVAHMQKARPVSAHLMGVQIDSYEP